MNEYEITVQIAKLKGWEIVEDTPEKVTWRSPQGKDFDVWPPLDQTIYFIPGFPMPIIKMAEAWDLLEEIEGGREFTVMITGNKGGSLGKWCITLWRTEETREPLDVQYSDSIKQAICEIYLFYRGILGGKNGK